MKFYPGYKAFDLFDDLFNDNYASKAPANLLKTDITEKNGYYELNMEVPGIHKEDIQLELKDGYLKVTATRNSNNEEKDDQGRIVRQERFSGSCSRSFYVGDAVTEEDIKASFENGTLKMTIPKKEAKAVPEKKFISIEG